MRLYISKKEASYLVDLIYANKLSEEPQETITRMKLVLRIKKCIDLQKTRK